MEFTINVANNLKEAGRVLRVFHQNGNESEERKLNFPGNGDSEGDAAEWAVHLGNNPGKDDWLEISVSDEKIYLEDCWIDVSPSLPFLLIPGEPKRMSAEATIDEYGTSIRIPGGLPTWKLRLLTPQEPAESTDSMTKTLAAASEGSQDLPDNGHNVTIGDDGPGGNGGKPDHVPWCVRLSRWIKNLFK
ncbi:MAG: hypothetical protein GY940_44220 [bacterium]|nr:hypothetical protein [bacterium]